MKGLENLPMSQRVRHENASVQEITIPEILARSARTYRKRVALCHAGTQITYGQLDDLVNRFAGALLELRVARDEIVALLMSNGPHVVIACQAVLRIGGIVAPHDPRQPAPELARRLKESGATRLITTDDNLRLALKLARRSKVRTIIAGSAGDFSLPADQQPIPARPPAPGVYRFGAMLGATDTGTVVRAPEWKDVAAILYTRGTTGVGKGVVLTHANLSCAVQRFCAWLRGWVAARESCLCSHPIHRAFGFMMQNASLLAGWKSILPADPTPQKMVAVMAAQQPSVLACEAHWLAHLLASKSFRLPALASMKACVITDGPLADRAMRRLRNFRTPPVLNVYGLTELSPMATATPWNGREKEGTVGVPCTGVAVKIADLVEAARDMPVGEAGEVLLKDPYVMNAYLNRPAETRAVFKDGWLRSGDIGFLDPDGHLTLLGRKAEMIAVGGFTVHPGEVDELLMRHPKILEACTIGVPHHHHGASIKAYVVPKGRPSIGKEALIEYCRQALAPYKVPRLIEIVDALPKSPDGTILRKELQALDRKQKKMG